MPPAGSVRRGGEPHVRSRGPEATGVSGGCLEPSAGSPSAAAQLESKLAGGCRFPTQAPISSISVVTPHGQRGFLPPSALQQLQHENPRLSANECFLSQRKKIQATLIHLEKEKFPCNAETGDVGRHHPTCDAWKGFPRREASGLFLHGARGWTPARSLPSRPGPRQHADRLSAAWPGIGSASGARVARPEPAAPWRWGLEN